MFPMRRLQLAFISALYIACTITKQCNAFGTSTIGASSLRPTKVGGRVADVEHSYYHGVTWQQSKRGHVLVTYSKKATSEDDVETRGNKVKRVVVVGGGWAGFCAADALASARTAGASSDDTPIEVVLLDASPRGKGGLAGGWRTPSGRPVEAGIHGFWREYKNTFAVLERLEGVEIDDILTPYNPSVLYSKSGRVALAPVLAEKKAGKNGEVEKMSAFPLIDPFNTSPDNLLQPLADLLPPPLDVAILSEFSPSTPLSVLDRLSGVGLLGAWADFGQEDPKSWERYDSVNAEDLFIKYAGVSRGLYDELVSPLLHVLPMGPGYDISAAAALSCFHVFALQSKGAFDVRWCRGSIAERIFNPWAEQLMRSGKVKIKGGSKVTSITEASNEDVKSGSKFKLSINEGEEILECDAVVLAVGGTAVNNIVAASPPVSDLDVVADFDKLRGVTCVAVRLFLKPDVITSGLSGGQHDSTQLPQKVAEAMKDSPVLVCGAEIGAIPELKEAGFCIYDLQRLHDEFKVGAQDNKDGIEETAVLEIDFFRADSLADIEDDNEVAKIALKAVASVLNIGSELTNAEIVDVAVVRARKAVSHFAPKSASYSPPVKITDGVFMCGDWIDRSGHASWSTEKAVVTGRQAAAAIASDWKLSIEADVIPAAPDTPQLSALRQTAQLLRSVRPPPKEIPPSPWAFVKDVLDSRYQ
mmetsp:Transcript_5489/g.8197  ORF Transcript_5489/g.8197 Transcript_5489/m.8197 type:complete len:700 (-) Transcript_5489:1359-3458(-)